MSHLPFSVMCVKYRRMLRYKVVGHWWMPNPDINESNCQIHTHLMTQIVRKRQEMRYMSVIFEDLYTPWIIYTNDFALLSIYTDGDETRRDNLLSDIRKKMLKQRQIYLNTTGFIGKLLFQYLSRNLIEPCQSLLWLREVFERPHVSPPPRLRLREPGKPLTLTPAPSVRGRAIVWGQWTLTHQMSCGCVAPLSQAHTLGVTQTCQCHHQNKS